MTMDSKVGPEGTYGREPFRDNVKRSIPPMVKGATGSRDQGAGQHGTAGKSSGNFKKAASFAQEQTRPRGTNECS